MARRRPPEEQLAELEQQQSQLKARIQKKRAEVSAKNRRLDTRRKIVAGAIALEHMLHDDEFAKAMHSLLNEHVKRPEDRTLFNL